MKQTNIYIKLLGILFITLLGSCQATEDFVEHVNSEKDEFLTTPLARYSIEMTRSNDGALQQWHSNNGDFEATVREEKWGNNHFSTRSVDLDEKVEWEDSVRVGLYIANTDETISDRLKNIPLNPISHAIYQEYCPKAFNMTLGADIITPETTPIIDGASYFWNSSKWSKASNVKANGSKNFYAYYPRPYDMNKGQDWLYVRNSIVDIKKITNTPWYKVSYDFWTIETDENLHQFDLMYSISETSGIDNRYGNKDEDGTSSIQMPFLHAFCLLDINISKGNYQGDFAISTIDFSGANVSTSGTLNIMDGTLTPSGSNGIITKNMETATKTGDTYNTTMIVPPVAGDVKLVCNVDGAEYKCVLPNIDFKSGNKYRLGLTMQANGDIYLQVWNGATATINGKSISGKEYVLTGAERATGKFTITSSSDYNITRVLKNGKEIATDKDASSGMMTCQFESNPKEKTYYTIVTEPTNWYVSSDKIRIQYDGLRNNPYKDGQDKTFSYWTDLSGHGYDGVLENFNLADAWSGKGLTFDGVKSIVTFPGTINPTEYTMEFYIFMEETQNTGGTPRLIAEGTDYPAYYYRKYTDSNNQIYWNVGLYGHGNGNVVDMGPKVYFGKYIMQLDLVYSDKTLKSYVTYWENGQKVQKMVTEEARIYDDAKEIPKASLGRRITDFTRALTGTYYSFILYDKALTLDDVNHNFEINYSRFGDQK